MATDSDPDQISRQEFGHTLRGYDPRQVRSYLEDVAGRVAAMQREAAELRSQIGEMDDRELEEHIDVTAAEVANVLHTARLAAQSLQARNTDEIEAARISANEAISNKLRAAEADAYRLRKAAWETSTQMLEQVRRAAAAAKKQADKDTLGIIGEAERNAHRKVSDAKREAESRSRVSRLESEKLLVEARASRDAMLEKAERSTDAAQERVRALERRHDELMRELEGIRADTLAASKDESVAREEFPVTSVKLVMPEDNAEPELVDDDTDDVRLIPSSAARWADGSDTVRLIPAGGNSADTPPPAPDVDPDLLVDELTDGSMAGVVEADEATDVVPGRHESAPSAERADSADDPPAISVEIPAHQTNGGGDDLGTLFDLLRDPEEGPAGTPSAPTGGEVSEETAVEDLVASDRPDPLELRDRALLAVMNRALRAVKRALSEIQNGQMEQLKEAADGFDSEPGALAALIDPELLILAREAHVAGVEAAATLAGIDDLDRTAIDRPAAIDVPFAADAHAAVMAAVGAERDAGSGVRELTAAVSKVYRVWRADEAERRIRRLAYGHYHQGVAAGLGAAGVAELTVEVVGAGCDVCSAAAGVHLISELESLPPLHGECRCLVSPL